MSTGKKYGKLIVIEGTDCSGKETQTKKLLERLQKKYKNVFCVSFPRYESPTGKIVGGPYLGKASICEGWFSEKAFQVDPLVASLYYAADRRYYLKELKSHLEKGDIVIIDRYVESNMAHQGAKFDSKEMRFSLYKKLEILEFELLEMPRPDVVFFLHLPYEYGEELKKSRIGIEPLDQHEANKEHLMRAEQVYLELTELFGFVPIYCVKKGKVRSIQDIHEEIYKKVEAIIENDKGGNDDAHR